MTAQLQRETSISAAPSASDEPFTDKLRELAAPLWEAQYQHPFVRGIADGSLDSDRFRRYLRQDYVYLRDYARAFSIAAARAPTLDLMRRLAGITFATLTTEMDLHRAYCARWGISEQQLESEAAGPTTRAYADYLLKTAALGDFAELIGALLPCLWGYQELACRLSAEVQVPNNPYAEWIGMYSSEDYAELAAFGRATCEHAAAGTSDDGRDRIIHAFVTSSRHELEFWDAAWQAEPPP
jgi:thiaminase (transcriptional activator TenA)